MCFFIFSFSHFTSNYDYNMYMARSDVLKNKRKTHRIVIVALIFICIYFVGNVLLSAVLKIKIFQPGVVLSVEKSIEDHKIGIQVGHWKNEELPDELAHLRGRSTGAQEYNITEWEVSLKVAELIKKELEKVGVAAQQARLIGLRVNAGHGLDYHNVKAIAAIPGSRGRTRSALKARPPRTPGRREGGSETPRHPGAPPGAVPPPPRRAQAPGRARPLPSRSRPGRRRRVRSRR